MERMSYIILLIIIISDNLAFVKQEFQSKNTNMSNKYSILLPTYNEKENLPIIVWLITKYMDERLVFRYF